MLGNTLEKLKKVKEDEGSVADRTLAKLIFSVGGDTATAGRILRKGAGKNQDNDQDSGASSIASMSSKDNLDEFRGVAEESDK